MMRRRGRDAQAMAAVGAGMPPCAMANRCPSRPRGQKLRLTSYMSFEATNTLFFLSKPNKMCVFFCFFVFNRYICTHLPDEPPPFRFFVFEITPKCPLKEQEWLHGTDRGVRPLFLFATAHGQVTARCTGLIKPCTGISCCPCFTFHHKTPTNETKHCGFARRRDRPRNFQRRSEGIGGRRSKVRA